MTDPIETLRSARDVARRCITLYAVVGAGHNEDRAKLCDWLRAEGLWDELSSVEEAFLTASEPVEKDFINATWRVEALHVLAWALGLFEGMDPLAGLCDVQRVQNVLPRLLEDTSEFVQGAALRDESDLREAADVLQDAHWEVRNGSSSENPGVVRERHYGLNWLIGYGADDWDSVPTDT